MRAPDARTGSRLLLAALPIFIALLATASPAAAVDLYPCGGQVSVPWTTEPVQPCPLTSPTGPEEGFPLYRMPVGNPPGTTPPEPDGWINGATNKYFVCHQQFPNALFYHPTTGWFNSWWAYTRTAGGVWGWVSEVFFKGGANDEPDYALRSCPPPPTPTPEPAPPSPPPPPPTPGPCVRSPASEAAKVQVAFPNHRRTTTVPFERRPLVKGRIVSSDGTPLNGAVLCIGVQRPGKPRVRAVGSVTAGANGRFEFRLGRGVSRRVWFVHRDGTGAQVNSLLVRVRAPVALGASRHKLRNGQAVELSGRLRVASRGGLLVEMQAQRGHNWQTFATTRTKRRGGFSYRYRFTRTYGLQTYKLRARIAKQPGSPFATGASKPVSVQVRG